MPWGHLAIAHALNPTFADLIALADPDSQACVAIKKCAKSTVVHPLQLHMVTMSHHPAGCSSSHVPWALAAAVMPSILPSAQRTLPLKPGLAICHTSHKGQVC